MKTPQAYPLSWPSGFTRTKPREGGRFSTTLPNAIKNVQGSLRRFAEDSGKKLENLVISSNVTLGTTKPADPGVSVWFIWDGLSVCIAVDRYTSIEGNLQAIHHIIEARRTELRHGTLQLVRASFQGFLSLPSSTSEKPWNRVLECSADAAPAVVQECYRRLARLHHPDAGGDVAKMAEINAAYEIAKRFFEP